MRWRKPYNNQTRVVKRFAIFPILIKGEYRWLETCYILQTYQLWTDVWLNTAFLTDDQIIEHNVERNKNET